MENNLEKDKAILPSEKDEKSRQCCYINKDLVAFKIHYFLLSAAHVGVIPYLPIYAKTVLGCSATTVGLIATCTQLSTTISKPLFGLLADYLNQMKILIASLLAIEALLCLLMLALPPISASNIAENKVTSTNQTHKLLKMAPAKMDLHSHPKSFEAHISRPLSHPISSGEINELDINKYRSETLKNNSCHVNCHRFITDAAFYDVSPRLENTEANSIKCFFFQKTMRESLSIKDSTNYTFTVTCQVKHDRNNSNATIQLKSHNIMFYQALIKNKSLPRKAILKNCTVHCTKFNKASYRLQENELNLFKTYQFWTFCIFALIGTMCQGAIYTLSDTVCYEHLRGTSVNFGHQRLWGELGWGFIAPITGYVDDLVTGSSIQEDYSPGWYVMALLTFCFLVNLYCMKIPNTKKAKNMCKAVRKVIFSREFLLMEINVFFIGVLSAYANYNIWYMESLGSNSIQMGLALAVACVFGNAPLMYFSEFLISKLGHWSIMNITFLAFSARFGAYYMLSDPWMILPVELFDGVTSGLFYIAMTSYSELISIPGTEATIQGVLGGTYQGLGRGIGCLLAGLSFDMFGGRRSFLFVSIASAFLVICQTFLYFICKPQKNDLNDLGYIKV